MVNPDEILGEADCRFLVRLDEYVRHWNIKHTNLRPINVSVDLNILEVMAGNGEDAKFIIPILLASGITISRYVSTDIIDSPVRQSLALGNNNEGKRKFNSNFNQRNNNGNKWNNNNNY